MKKLFAIAIILTMMVWRCTEPAHAQEDVDGAVSTNAPIWYTTAPLFIRSGPHDWLVVPVHVVEYPDSRPVMCVARKDSQIVDCFYKNNVTGEGYLFSELPKERRG